MYLLAIMWHKKETIRITLFKSTNQIIFKIVVQGKRDSGITESKLLQIFIFTNHAMQVSALQIK